MVIAVVCFVSDNIFYSGNLNILVHLRVARPDHRHSLFHHNKTVSIRIQIQRKILYTVTPYYHFGWEQNEASFTFSNCVAKIFSEMDPSSMF